MDAFLEVIHPHMFDEWLAKDVIEPIGQAGVVALLGQIATMLASFGKEDSPPTPQDIMEAGSISGAPWKPWRPPEQRVTAAVIASQVSSIPKGK